MKFSFSVHGKFGGLDLILLGTLLSLALLGTGCNPFKSARDDAIDRINKVGGFNAINLEAKTVFNRFRTNQVKVLYDADLKDVPALASLGNLVAFQGESPGYAACVRVRYGSHWNTRDIVIYESTQTNPNLGNTAQLVMIITNIFVRIPK